MKKPLKHDRRNTSHSSIPQKNDILITAGILTSVTIISFAFQSLGISDANLIMVFIFGVVLTSVKTGRVLGVIASISSVILFNFFFTEPRFTFEVEDSQYLLTFIVMLSVSLITSALTVREKNLAINAADREIRSNVLFLMSRALLTVNGNNAICKTALNQIHNVISGVPVIYLIKKDGSYENPIFPDINDNTTVFNTETFLPDILKFNFKLRGAEKLHGLLFIILNKDYTFLNDEDRSLIETFTAQISLALDRELISLQREEANVRAENEKLRVTILRSISHDLRTPLAGITGASSTLLANPEGIEKSIQQELLTSIYDEATWLSDMVENILSLSRVQSSGGIIRKVPEVLDDVLYSAVQKINKRFQNHKLKIFPPEEVILVPIEGILIEQVLINLLDNAISYTPLGTGIDLSAREIVGVGGQPEIEFTVVDNGPGIPKEIMPTLFDLFKPVKTNTTGKRRGSGLGLGICKTIVEAHGGYITGTNRAEGGACFRFILPKDDKEKKYE
ncbi:MAG: DUF4118 domain-containing protein [Spirochaetaceae bacterium]|jgi:two-component system sensor histidine kinase KdpD|nr:DUF4118 domain-containing protein [Spirochaetaceae bacterium]